MKKITKIFFMVFVIFQTINCKVRLLTFHYNRPDFVEIQHRCLQKFLKDDYELIVFNDAKDSKIEKEIESVCKNYGIKCVRYNQEWHHNTSLISEVEKWNTMEGLTGFSNLGELKGFHPSIRHCNVIQYAMQNYAYEHDDIVGLLDGDMFLIKDFSIRKEMENFDIMANTRKDGTQSVEFLWVGLAFFDVSKLPNKKTLSFSLSKIDNHITDSGGHSYYFLQNNPLIKLKKLSQTSVIQLTYLSPNELKSLGFNNYEIYFIKNAGNCSNCEFHFNNHFVHYCRSSFMNEENPHASETKQYHKIKSNIFNDFINNILGY